MSHRFKDQLDESPIGKKIYEDGDFKAMMVPLDEVPELPDDAVQIPVARTKMEGVFFDGVASAKELCESMFVAGMEMLESDKMVPPALVFLIPGDKNGDDVLWTIPSASAEHTYKMIKAISNMTNAHAFAFAGCCYVKDQDSINRIEFSNPNDLDAEETFYVRAEWRGKKTYAVVASFDRGMNGKFDGISKQTGPVEVEDKGNILD
jgi:hypothetical protein